MYRIIIAASMAFLLCVPEASAQTRNNRVGLWGGFGLGAGNMGCLESGCENRHWGFSGNAKLGGTVSPSLRLAGGTNGYYRQEDDFTLRGGTVTFEVYWYPGAKDVYLLGGAGVAAIEAEAFGFTETETGAGFLVGIGWDLALGGSGNLALTPFGNWIITTVDPTIDFFQFGLGLTFN